MHNCYVDNYIVEMSNFNSFVDKLDMELWREIYTKNDNFVITKRENNLYIYRQLFTTRHRPMPLLVTISICGSLANNFLSLVMNTSRLREAK